jgi:hypothetical protein
MARRRSRQSQAMERGSTSERWSLTVPDPTPPRCAMDETKEETMKTRTDKQRVLDKAAAAHPDAIGFLWWYDKQADWLTCSSCTDSAIACREDDELPDRLEGLTRHEVNERVLEETSPVLGGKCSECGEELYDDNVADQLERRDNPFGWVPRNEPEYTGEEGL